MINIPLTGFGTWQLREPHLTPAIREAVRVGYRHFDSAAIYENEAELGAVFDTLVNKEKTVKREEVRAVCASDNDKSSLLIIFHCTSTSHPLLIHFPAVVHHVQTLGHKNET